uniref:Uncharacterized protein n=1 Tax=Arsenophonus nasoniae TaxID=638 RepID=D2U4R0_9GAMM|nr:hypothetical protein ARN_36920 [Arsenophonus nasoniae]
MTKPAVLKALLATLNPPLLHFKKLPCIKIELTRDANEREFVMFDSPTYPVLEKVPKNHYFY